MIKMTITEILNVVPVLQEMSNKSFPGATSFKIARLMRELDKEIQLFDKQRNEIAQEFGEKDASGQLVLTEEGNVKIIESKIKECNEKLASIFNTVIEINADKISYSTFEGVNIAPAEALALEPIIDFE